MRMHIQSRVITVNVVGGLKVESSDVIVFSCVNCRAGLAPIGSDGGRGRSRPSGVGTVMTAPHARHFCDHRADIHDDS